LGNAAKPLVRERLNFIYLVRAFAIIGVIVVHVTSTPVGDMTESSFYSTYNLMNVLFRFGTTTFLFLSAFVLFYNYYDRKLDGKLLATFYKRRLLYIIVPYVIWSAAYYVFQLWMLGGWSFVQSRASFPAFWQMLMSGDAYYHLYFIYINAQFYIAFPLLLWLLQRFPIVARTIVPIGIALQVAFAFANLQWFQFPDKGSMALSYVSYYLLGAYLGIYYPRIKAWFTARSNARVPRWPKRSAWLLVWFVWLGSVAIDAYLWLLIRTGGRTFDPIWYELSLQLRSLLTIVVLVRLAHLAMHYVRRGPLLLIMQLGGASFGIYIVHAGILSLFNRFVPVVNPPYYHVVIAASFVVTLAIAWLIAGVATKYMKGSWLLFGQSPKPVSLRPDGSGKPAYPINQSARQTS